MRPPSVNTRRKLDGLVAGLLLSVSVGCEGSKVYGPSSERPLELFAFIHVADSSGKLLGRLVEGGWPSWSPDGRHILFERDFHVRVIDTDGTNERDLGSGRWPAWSPDGSRIAFASAEGISIMNADGSATRPLLTPALMREHNWGVGKSAWSSDGALIAFDEPGGYDEGGTARIFVVRADGTTQYVPGGYGQYESEPSWSPDGSNLVYWSSDIGLLFVPRGGGLPVQLSGDDAARFAARPAWSPDGRTILFNGKPRDRDSYPPPERPSASIMAISSDGGSARMLIEQGGDAAWSPDGTRIAFVRWAPR
jgi:Tol biopolymer transport system component